MSTKRIVTNTLIHLTRPDGVKLSFGEGQRFEIYNIRGLGIGEIEKETVGNALMDGELWLGSRVLNRVIEIESYWNAADQRSFFTDFFQHNVKLAVEVEYNGSRYFGSCVLHEAYDAEDHGGSLYSGSEIEVSLFFPDPYLYTETVYQYQIGHDTTFNKYFYTHPSQHSISFPPRTGYAYYFSVFREAQEYSINNPSSSENGFEATIRASGPVVNPGITNITTGLSLKLNLTMVPDDVLYLNTQLGFVTATLNGVNVLRYLTMESRMIQLQPGRNTLLFAPDQGSSLASCEISFRGKVIAL